MRRTSKHHNDPPKNERYCHCGRQTAYALADHDQRSDWWAMSRDGDDWYWLTMPYENCTPCWYERCDVGGVCPQ